MRYTTPLFLVALSLGLTFPVAAQDGNVATSFFMTVDDANVPELEEGLRDHAEWHVRQGDPWQWAVWQAVTGPPEYAYVSAGHDWSDFDNPSVDPGEDASNWSETGGPYSERIDARMWVDMTEVSQPFLEPPTMLQVFEFSVNPGGDEALMHFAQKFVDAARSTNSPVRFVWSRVVSAAAGSTHFVAVPLAGFAALGDMGEPFPMLVEAYGMTEARQLFATFADAATSAGSRIWVLRPDLSHGLN
jgi:hypothetical protein